MHAVFNINILLFRRELPPTPHSENDEDSDAAPEVPERTHSSLISQQQVNSTPEVPPPPPAADPTPTSTQATPPPAPQGNGYWEPSCLARHTLYGI